MNESSQNNMKGNMRTNTPSFALNLLQVAARGPGLPDKGIFFAVNRDRKSGSTDWLFVL